MPVKMCRRDSKNGVDMKTERRLTRKRKGVSGREKGEGGNKE